MRCSCSSNSSGRKLSFCLCPRPTKSELSALERERSDISNRIRRPKSPEEQAQSKERRKAVSRQMKPVRERLRRAERILEKSPHLYELLKQEHELEKKARARYKERGR